MPNPKPTAAPAARVERLRKTLTSTLSHLRETLQMQGLMEETPPEVRAVMASTAKVLEEATLALKAVSSGQAPATPRPAHWPTPQQGQFLAYIDAYMSRSSGVGPTHAVLQGFFNLTPPSVNSMLKRLEERGFIRRIPGQARAISLTIDPALIPPLDRPFK
ncbi:LexA family protein [Thiocystis violacea]|uniref:LexA family protein n=1 Tax=Thiocystis violacea TaxID=13725 RepID=UPI001F5BA98F|nr:MarR family transcriptional regulator [Thiocystis violacea]